MIGVKAMLAGRRGRKLRGVALVASIAALAAIYVAGRERGDAGRVDTPLDPLSNLSVERIANIFSGDAASDGGGEHHAAPR